MRDAEMWRGLFNELTARALPRPTFRRSDRSFFILPASVATQVSARVSLSCHVCAPLAVWVVCVCVLSVCAECVFVFLWSSFWHIAVSWQQQHLAFPFSRASLKHLRSVLTLFQSTFKLTDPPRKENNGGAGDAKPLSSSTATDENEPRRHRS